jgi:hypothetical protein
MEADFVRRFIDDVRHTYRACATSLGVQEAGSDLAALLRVARQPEFKRRGEVTSESGTVYAYHVHGAGYSFKDLKTGKEIHFDTMLVDGAFQIRFSPWNLHRYASSIGEVFSEDSVRSALKTLSATASFFVHVVDGPFDYYLTNE